jgi:hypothetical protein
MRRRWLKPLVLLGVLGASGAGAEGERKLYIKTKDTKLLKEPKATAAAVGKPLQPGTEVTWKGASPKDKEFHEVEVDARTKGFVLRGNLSPSKPQSEVLGSSGTPISAQAFASSGAASKALTPAGISYAKKEGPKAEEAAAEIIHVEEHNKAHGTPEAIAAKSKQLGGGK